mgnify:CR=1 FL=1
MKQRPLTLVVLSILLSAPALADPLGETPQEIQAVVHLDRHEFPTARTLAEKSLKTKPTFMATFVMGVVHALGEGNLARGLYLIKESKKLLTAKYTSQPTSTDAQRWHKRILSRQIVVLGMMDRRNEQLKALDAYDALYKPKMSVWRLWPLLKLERYDEARSLGRTLIHHDEAYIRERAYNGLMAVEEEAGFRLASYNWGQRGLLETKRKSCIIATNLALGARHAFKFTEAIEHDQTALAASDGSCPTSPHAQLAAVFLVMGEFQKALSSLKELRAMPRTIGVRLQNETMIRARFVELLLALGDFGKAAVRARKIVEAPDRAGIDSRAAELIEMGNNILAWSALNARKNQIEERIQARSFWDGMGDRQRALMLKFELWTIERRILRLAAMKNVLVRTMRPYLTDVMPWYGIDMAYILGRGITESAMEEALAIEKDFPELAQSVMDAFRGEQAWRSGETGKAEVIGRRLLMQLPPEARLVKMRVQAWLADTIKEKNRIEAESLFHQVIDFYPTVLRQLNIEIPVSIVFSGPQGEDVAERLRDSPRLDVQQGGSFTVEINTSPQSISICLAGGKRFGCAEVKKEGHDEDLIVTAIDAFHDQVFSPKLELTQSDITSLDGRAVRQDARGAVDALLGKEKRK